MFPKSQTLKSAPVRTLLAVSIAASAHAQAQDVEKKPTDNDNLYEEVTVVGTQASLQRARDLERASDVWKNVVAADDIGNFPDQNVAESLQRLPGLSISRDEGEGRFVSVRGLSPAFNNVTINGVRMGGTGEESRDNIVSLDTVPSDLLNGIEVSKASTPDMDGDAIAGTVNLKTLTAFDRKGDSFTMRTESSYNERSGEMSPKVSGSYTKLFDTAFGANTLGIALTGSGFERDIVLDDLRVARSDGTDLIARETAQGTYYQPQEIDQRLEIGTRTRTGATANIAFRPDDNNELYLNLTASKLRDEDIRVQQEWETRRATGSEIKVIGPNTGVLDDVDLEKQIFYKDTTSKNFSASLGGEHMLDQFELSYQLDYSESSYRNPLGTRGQFRERDELVKYTSSEDGVTIDATPDTDEYSRSKSGVDITDPSKFTFDNVLIDDVKSEDEISSARLDGKWNLEIGGMPGAIKAGIKVRDRSKFQDKEQLDMSPGDFGFDVTMADIGYYNPKNTNLDNFKLIPDLDAAKELFFQARDAMVPTGFNTSNPNDDFTIDEKINAAYVMSQFDLNDQWNVIAGARVEQTKLDSAGNITENLMTCNDAECSTFTTTQVLGEDIIGSQDFSDVLPSLHFRYEPSDDLVFRLALTKAVKRPSFNENRPNIGIITMEQEDGSFTRAYTGGNPNLDTLKANQADFLVSWYPSDNLALSGGIFYKDITDFIVEGTLEGAAVTQAGFAVGDGTQTGGYDVVTTFFNGEEAKVQGVELNYFQSFASVPGIFVDGNVTFADSTSRVEQIRPGETFRLPDQPKMVGNLSVGYENDLLSLRLSGNYVGEKVETIASDSAADEIREARFSMDFGAQYYLSDTMSIYIDAINLNEAKDVRVFRNGDNAPRMFESVQDYGRTLQLGFRANF
ncbi:TonB-dependent receptor [Microbulbifer magnicolonia]|uniref:TonB-dependent receptor n=1 Tax=Microbulbifer magnicolonia TaxID=3109744 RepID=UPI002B408847|nr:TonB-dependent receptor [Microbulbifer sp. GG15]